jgi:hypothetical protein
MLTFLSVNLSKMYSEEIKALLSACPFTKEFGMSASELNRDN